MRLAVSSVVPAVASCPCGTEGEVLEQQYRYGNAAYHGQYGQRANQSVGGQQVEVVQELGFIRADGTHDERLDCVVGIDARNHGEECREGKSFGRTFCAPCQKSGQQPYCQCGHQCGGNDMYSVAHQYEADAVAHGGDEGAVHVGRARRPADGGETYGGHGGETAVL